MRTITMPKEEYDQLQGSGEPYPDPDPNPIYYAMVMGGTAIALLLAALLADCLQALTLILGLINLGAALYLLGWKVHRANMKRMHKYYEAKLKSGGPA